MHSRAPRDDNNQLRFIAVTYYVWRKGSAYGGVLSEASPRTTARR